ncbi:hypothetical protein VP01_315g2 [Puccinia sorghi]|uniref:Retrovirus-related Pol polyprotein from transposon TNT 1-94-like beta-barrel domain-containing protein n=1 Tax=Puccinia sorghi TaxID=27349 RepID=A0A0L6UZM8_9BASI|nr:hypothetical protein VP01_315g2 [Puccinia sorghi]
MVRTSMRKHLINSLLKSIDDDMVLLAVSMAMEVDYYSDEESDEELNDILHRYLNPKVPIEKAPHISDFLLHRLEDNCFKQEFLMLRDPFMKLCDLISRRTDDGDFEEAWLLWKWSITIQGQFLSWPNAEARQEISDEYEDQGFKGCAGVIDGSLIIVQSSNTSLNLLLFSQGQQPKLLPKSTPDILMNYMTETVFELVITPDNEENPHQIWMYEFKEFITDMHKMLTEIAICKLAVPNNILSFSILAQLNEDLYNVVKNIIMNEAICESPLLHSLSSKKSYIWRSLGRPKINPPQRKERDPYCESGKHNPSATSHDEDHCYQLHPHLCPKFLNHSEKATTQLMEPIVLDSGATHHMVNDPACFTPTAETNMKISTGGHSNLLYATAFGKATLVNHKGKTVFLENVLLVPTLTRSLISIPQLFKKSLTIEKTIGDGVKVCIDRGFTLQGSLKHNLLELVQCSFLVIKSFSSCYQSNPVLVPKSEIEECSICKE